MGFRTVVLFSCLIFKLPSVLGQLCPDGWLESPISDYCFSFNLDRNDKTWQEAREACQATLGDLAWYSDEKERGFITTTADRLTLLHSKSKTWWIGVTKVKRDGSWQWVTGEKAVTNLLDLATQEPDNSGNQNQNCGALHVHRNMSIKTKMKTDNCHGSFPYICKRHKAVVGGCPDQWQNVDDSCFRLFHTEEEWQYANDNCRQYGAHLATVDSEIQQQFLFDAARFSDKAIWIGYWAGLNKEHKTLWMKRNEALKHTDVQYWVEGAPPTPSLRSGQGNYTCVVIDPTTRESRKSWAPENCRAERPYICRKQKGHCASGWLQHNRTCYQFDENIKLSWYDADTYCKSQGAELISVQSKDVQKFLTPLLQELGAGARLWLGGSANGSCAQGWEAHAFSCYYFARDESVTWLKAEKTCRDNGASLVKVDNAREMSFISQKLTTSSWLGLNNRHVETQWVWPDGEMATFTNWAPNKPSSNGTGFHCAAVLTGNALGRWTNTRCDHTKDYICEKMIGPAITSGTTTAAAPFTSKCGLFWEDNPLSDFCYQFNVDTLSWAEAQRQCEINNGYLASIASLHEQQYITARVQSIPNMRFYWLGGNDAMYDNSWEWTDGSPFAFFNWEAGQPYATKYGHCVEIDASKGTWRDENCSRRQGYICKKKGASTMITGAPNTEPTATVDQGVSHCTGDWTLYAGSCFKVFNATRAWPRARDTCRREGGDLAYISNANENNLVTSLAGEKEGWREFWIGFNSLRITNQFEWSGGTEVSFTSWSAGEPHAGKEENVCVGLYTSAQNAGRWNANECIQPLPFVCRKPAPKMVSPPTVTYEGCQGSATWTYKASCYGIASTGETWSDALQNCNKSGGTLLEINDRLEQAYIGSQLGDRGVNTEHWIGLNKGDKGDSYSWTSGEHVAYTNWDQTHSGNGEYVCVAITVSGKTAGKWADRACSQTKSYICEYPRKGYQQNKVGTTPRPPACPLEHYWRGYGDYCYKRVFGRQTWFQARELCKNLGGDLASFHSQRQMNEAADVPQYASGYRDNFWIGLHKPTKNSSYVWTDGSALDYTNWDEGEPNDHNGLESCVELNRGQRGLWNDANCYTLKQCICQVKRGEPVYTSLSTPATTKAPHCGNDTNWLSHGDYCYYLSLRYGRGAQLPWHDAKIYCIQNGGDLISIHSVDENNFLISQAYDSRQFWIGLNVLDFESYKWSDGSVLDFLAWDVNQPTNLYGGQRCATFSKLTGNWGNENCGEYKNYICKRHKDTRTTVAPTPTPVILGGCPTGFQGIGNKCYMIVGDDIDSSKLKAWNESIHACATFSKRSVLASVTNSLETAFLTTVLKDKTINYWIGLSIQWVGYKRRYRRFRWADNSKIDYTNWDFGEPSGTSYTPKEDCVAVASKGNSIGRWRDHGCNIKMGYICQTWKDPNLPTSQAPTQAGSLCPTGYESFGSACYQLTSPMTWEEANVTCEGQQDSLVSILDPHEQAFLVLMMHRNDTQPVWIGLHRNRSSFEWVDGWLVNYVNWNAREPSRNTGDYCVLLDTNGRWNDTVCYRKFRAICKKTTVRPPTPTVEIPGTCPDATWHPYGSYCYFMSKGYAMWAGGIFQCHKKGATLASITDQGEMDFILRTVREQLLTVDLWIGLYRNLDGSLRWYDGTPINYENWGIGQPSSEKDMDCVYAAKGRGDWQAGRCGLAIGYICKVPKVLATTPLAPACRDGWYQRNSMCYKGFYKSRRNTRTWADARSFCQLEGGDLASFHSSVELNWYLDTLGTYFRYTLGRDMVWIGLHAPTNTTDGAEHIWSDSTETNFTNWDDGQPDNHNGMERCVGMFATTGKWRDENCASARGWICTVPLGATTVSKTTEGTSLVIAGVIQGASRGAVLENGV
ncbi:macrophage mannose receptor 1 [Lingula anatina]|uniref:Macrophage mannose receptor 1 n=1 Tax=Lingula anatina TaxID=7574 RepID=A0A2R2MQ52_LINAN|nr:macrophage mannose receptor 1 [Lingula anatina]|eukprot:XP_023932374.1 macrophage mannose receptor 1 [Lingula anatina]